MERVVSKEQIQSVVVLAKEIWEEHYTPIIGEAQVSYMIATFQSQEAIIKQIENGYEYYLIKEELEEIGYVAVCPEENRLFLSKLYIKKEARGKGHSKRILQKVQDICKEQGFSSVYLTCNKYNSASLKAYDSLGFSICQEEVSDIGNGYVMDDYVLEMKIGGIAV